MKRCIILNPRAGSVKNRAALLKQLKRLGASDVHITKKPGAARSYARAAIRKGCNEIISVGGDGTLNEVINAVAPQTKKVRVGLIPLGTGNDFARCLNLPSDVDENIDIILAEKSRAIDVVCARSNRTRYFVNVSAGGFSGLVNEKLTPAIKRTWGPLAYIRSAAAAWPQLHAYHTKMVFDDSKELALDLYNVVIANGRFVAGGLPIAPKAKLHDGLLDVVLIPKRSPAEMVLVAAQLALGKHLSSKAIIFRRARKVTVRSRPGMWFNVDGELVGNSPVCFEVMPRALNFIVIK